MRALPLVEPGPADVVVDIDWSGISTGTERLLWLGRMPAFPGMGYPLVPGYESVGRVRGAGAQSGRAVGDFVFVPGAACYGEVRGLFGGAASRVVVPGARTLPIPTSLADQGVLLALAATAHHAIVAAGSRLPDLVIGHGVLGRLIARLVIACGGEPPLVWEREPGRTHGACGYRVAHPDDTPQGSFHTICDVSGDASILDTVMPRLARRGEIVLAGFYSQPLSFAFPPAFMREARMRVAAEWAPHDLVAVRDLIDAGRLQLDGLITHTHSADDADEAYRTAFGDPACLKMVLDWRGCA